MPDFSRVEYMTSYLPLCLELDVDSPGSYEPGDQFWFDDSVHVGHPTISAIPQGAVWLPGIFDWPELLEVAGHAGIAFENTAPAGDQSRAWVSLRPR